MKKGILTISNPTANVSFTVNAEPDVPAGYTVTIGSIQLWQDTREAVFKYTKFKLGAPPVSEDDYDFYIYPAEGGVYDGDWSGTAVGDTYTTTNIYVWSEAGTYNKVKTPVEHVLSENLTYNTAYNIELNADCVLSMLISTYT